MDLPSSPHLPCPGDTTLQGRIFVVFDEERGDDPFERISIADESTYQAGAPASSAEAHPGGAVRRKVVELARDNPRWTSTDIRAALQERYDIRISAAAIERILSTSVPEHQ
jgi:hypothetical protein